VTGSDTENWMKVWNSSIEVEFELNAVPDDRKLNSPEEMVKMRNH